MKTHIIFLTLVVLLHLSLPAAAVKTPEVEFGHQGLYDGKAKIWRDAQDTLQFQDGELTTATSLLELQQGRAEHSQLLGLGGDDHPQYLNTTRHQQNHTLEFNNALFGGPDPAGNATLGAHLQDSRHHLNREAEEAVNAPWTFYDVSFFKAGLQLGQSDGQDAFIEFGEGASQGKLNWNQSEQTFSFNASLEAPEAELTQLSSEQLKLTGEINGADAQQQPSATLANFASIEGISSSNLLDRSASENIPAGWHFLAGLEAVLTTSTLNAEEKTLNVELDAELDSEDPLSGLQRLGARMFSWLRNTGSGSLAQTLNAGVKAEAKTSALNSDSLNNIGLMGSSSSQGQAVNTIGVMGVAEAVSENRSRIGVYGGLDPAVATSPQSLPEGDWAGYFAGDVKVEGDLLGAPNLEAKKHNTVTVAKSGGDFTTISDALASITDSCSTNTYTILIYPGVYERNEYILLNKSYVSLVGVGGRDDVILKRHNPVSGAMGNDDAVLTITASNCELRNLTIYNTGEAPDATPALLVENPSDNVHVRNCHLLGGGRDVVTLWSQSGWAYFDECLIEHIGSGAHLIWFHDGKAEFTGSRLLNGTTQFTGGGEGTFERCYLEGDSIFDCDHADSKITVENIFIKANTGLFSGHAGKEYLGRIFTLGTMPELPNDADTTIGTAGSTKIRKFLEVSNPAGYTEDGEEGARTLIERRLNALFGDLAINEPVLKLRQEHFADAGLTVNDTSPTIYVQHYDSGSGTVNWGDFVYCEEDGSKKLSVDKDGNVDIASGSLYKIDGTALNASDVGAIADASAAVKDTHIDWGTETNQVDLDDIPDGATYGRVAASELVSGFYKDATTAVKGIASFSGSFFSVIGGEVLIKNDAIGEEQLGHDIDASGISFNADAVDGYDLDQGVKTTDSPSFQGLSLTSVPGGVGDYLVLDGTTVKKESVACPVVFVNDGSGWRAVGEVLRRAEMQEQTDMLLIGQLPGSANTRALKIVNLKPGEVDYIDDVELVVRHSNEGGILHRVVATYTNRGYRRLEYEESLEWNVSEALLSAQQQFPQGSLLLRVKGYYEVKGHSGGVRVSPEKLKQWQEWIAQEPTS